MKSFRYIKTDGMKYTKIQLTVDIESLNVLPEATRQTRWNALIREMESLGKASKMPFRVDIVLPSKLDYLINQEPEG